MNRFSDAFHLGNILSNDITEGKVDALDVTLKNRENSPATRRMSLPSRDMITSSRDCKVDLSSPVSRSPSISLLQRNVSGLGLTKNEINFNDKTVFRSPSTLRTPSRSLVSAGLDETIKPILFGKTVSHSFSKVEASPSKSVFSNGYGKSTVNEIFMQQAASRSPSVTISKIALDTIAPIIFYERDENLESSTGNTGLFTPLSTTSHSSFSKSAGVIPASFGSSEKKRLSKDFSLSLFQEEEQIALEELEHTSFMETHAPKTILSPKSFKQCQSNSTKFSSFEKISSPPVFSSTSHVSIQHARQN